MRKHSNTHTHNHKLCSVGEQASLCFPLCWLTKACAGQQLLQLPARKPHNTFIHLTFSVWKSLHQSLCLHLLLWHLPAKCAGVDVHLRQLCHPAVQLSPFWSAPSAFDTAADLHNVVSVTSTIAYTRVIVVWRVYYFKIRQQLHFMNSIYFNLVCNVLGFGFKRWTKGTGKKPVLF